MRAEIHKSIAQDYYAVPPMGYRPPQHRSPISHNSFPSFRKNKLKHLLGSTQDAAADEKVGDQLDTETHAIYSKNDVRTAKCREPLNEYRDALSIRALKETVELSVGATVRAWKTLNMHKHRPTLIGITDKSVVLIVSNHKQFVQTEEIVLETQPIAFATYMHWNDSQHIEGCVVVGMPNNILFLRVSHDLNMEIVKSVPIHQHLVALYHFTIDHAHKLVVLSPDDATRSTLADIYTFDEDTKDLLLNQELRLDVQTHTMAVLDGGKEQYICFPQQHEVRIYAYTFKWFEFYVSIPAVNAQAIATFRMGGQSYLAIGGDAPRILRYFNGQFHSQTILEKSWGRVEAFMPVTARTYRDDLILLVQHRIDYDTHAVAELDALIWNGQAFDTDLTTPCYVFGRPVEGGLQCLLDIEHEAGISGAAVINTDQALQVLVPRFEASPALFDIEFALEATSTEQNENEVMVIYREVAALLDAEDDLEDDAAELSNCIGSAKVEITDQTLSAFDTIELEMKNAPPLTHISVAGDQFTVGELEQFLLIMNDTEASLEKQPETAPKHKRETSNDVHVVRSLKAEHLVVENINGIPIADLITAINGAFRLNGTLVISNVIHADRVERRRADDSVAASHDQDNMVHMASWNIPDNLDVDIINGRPWWDFVNNLVFKNDPESQRLDLQVNGVSSI